MRIVEAIVITVSFLPASIAKAATPVKVLVCTEALCPDCEHFVHETLMPVYHELGPDVFTLELVPFGNAKVQDNGTAICQHGVGECDANVYENCAIHYNPNPADYLPFVDCLTQSLPMGHHDEPLDPKLFQNCASEANLWWSAIQACHAQPKVANKLVKAAAAATPSYHKYVPWIEIEGTHLEEEKEDFKTEVCKAFMVNGGSHPACSSV